MTVPPQDQRPINPVPGFQHPYPPPQPLAQPTQMPPAGQEFLTSSPTNPQPKRERKRFGWLAVIIIAVGAFLLGYAVGATPAEPESGAFTQDTGYHSTEPSTVPESTDSDPTEGPGHTSPADPVSPKPKITRAQQQALESAQSYLESGGFSRNGLIDQLSSKYGEDFDKKDAVWAVDHAGADWKAEAVESAESYMDSGGFSKRSLEDQLASPYGEDFTRAQAHYAVEKVYK